MAKEEEVYYLFSTGPGITLYISTDKVIWKRVGRVFPEPVAWAQAMIPGARSCWAPDISHFGGRWHLYYSISTFGSNRSAIGLATNDTLDSRRPDYRWRDEGLVIESHHTDNWNAIDPNVVLTEDGTSYLTFGSFWGGLKLIRLDATMGKPIDKAELISIAARPHTPETSGGAIEAPFIFRHEAYYYLFVSFDLCCRGADSTYNIRVGRSKAVDGPYRDRDERDMREGGGTLVIAGSGRWRGPGHCAAYHMDNADWLIYHAYDTEDKGRAKLRIAPITWTPQGWPTVP